MKRTVASFSGNSHTDDIACKKNKEVSDPAVAHCPREDAASSLFVLLQCTMLFGVLSSEPFNFNTDVNGKES